MSYKSIVGVTPDEDLSKIINSLSTSYLTGGLITINGGNPAKFDISAGTGYVINNYTDPDNPTLEKVSFGPFTAQTITNLATQPTTFLGINSSGSIVQKNTVFTNEDWRDVFSLGTLIHPNNTSISDIGSVRLFGADSLLQLSDLSLSVGNINIAGNNYSPNGANLNLNKSAGQTFKLGANAIVSKKNPNIVTNPSLSLLTFVYVYRDGSGGISAIPSQTAVDPDRYDDGSGTLVPVPNNKWTTQHVTYFTNSDITVIEYGQIIYNSRVEAEANIVTEDFESFPEAGLGSFRLWLIVKDTTTDLEDPDNFLISAGKFGAISPSGGGGGGGLTDLQGAYDNSVNPETVLDATRGAITIRDNATPISAPLFEIQSNDGATDYLNVSATGTTLNTPLTVPSGGTGKINLTDGGMLLGSGTGAISATSQPTNGQLLIGSTGNDPVLNTLSGGVGINTQTGPGTSTINLSTPVSAQMGGTGRTSLTDGGIVLGNGAFAVNTTSQPTNGQLLIGSTGNDPVLNTLTAGSGVNIANGSGATTINVDNPAPSSSTNWTPILTIGNSSGLVYTSFAKSIQIGALVYFFLQIQLSAMGTGSGGALISGIPVNPLAFRFPMCIRANNFLYPDNSRLQGRIAGNTIILSTMTNTGTLATVNQTNFTDTTELQVSATYLSA